jgi:two-component system, OmpR family, response regulator
MELPSILIVDDEPGIRDLLTDALSLAGYRTLTAPDGMAATFVLRTNSVDLVIADVNMPHLDGYHFLERLRASGDTTPVLFLTARTDNSDVAQGLKLGADDYVTKPFRLEELLLRVAAILRRTRPIAQTILLEVGPIVLDMERHEVTFNRELVELSPTEFLLLQTLMERAGKVVSKRSLLDLVWNLPFDTSTNVVDTYISYLRKKLHRDNFEGIMTVRGIGFKLTGEQ